MSHRPACALVLFARAPRPGRVKTRMAPWLDAGEALALHRALLQDSIVLLKKAAKELSALPLLAFSEPWRPEPGNDDESLADAAGGIDRLPQRGEDLGERLRNAFAALFARGHRGVVIFGSDSPALAPERLREACALLERGAEAVLGPADDGGYYLVGLRRPHPDLFAGIPWGTARVCRATLEAARRAGFEPALLPSCYDVDLPGDLLRLRRDSLRWAEEAEAGRPAPRRTLAFLEELVRRGRL